MLSHVTPCVSAESWELACFSASDATPLTCTLQNLQSDNFPTCNSFQSVTRLWCFLSLPTFLRRYIDEEISGRHNDFSLPTCSDGPARMEAPGQSPHHFQCHFQPSLFSMSFSTIVVLNVIFNHHHSQCHVQQPSFSMSFSSSWSWQRPSGWWMLIAQVPMTPLGPSGLPHDLERFRPVEREEVKDYIH